MRLSTILVSSVFVLAGMSSAIPVVRKDMLVARFADSDSLADVEARAYGDGPGLYSRGGSMSFNIQSQLRNIPAPSPPPPSPPPSYDPPPYQRTPPSHAQTNSPPPSYRSSWKDPVVTRWP